MLSNTRLHCYDLTLAMNILWLSHLVPYPPKAGALLRTYYLVRGVARENELDLVAFVQEPVLRAFYPSLNAALEDCRQQLQGICRSVTFLPIEKLRRPLGKPLTALESLLTHHCYMARWLEGRGAREALARRVRQSAYDLAHLDCVSLACYRPVLGSMPATLGHHNAESHMLLRRSDTEKSRLRSWYFRQEGRRLAQFEAQQSARFAAHITCSDLDTERLRQTMPSARFITIPNGVDLTYFQPMRAASRPSSLIFISSMSWYPNIDAALFLLTQIWPAIRARVAHATLDIVGSGAPRSVVAAIRAVPGVTLHGYLPDLRPLMDSAALYICPVRSGGGTKLKVLDALAMGKCIIAHPIACEGINVTDGENVIFASTPNEFASRVHELLDSPSSRARIGAAARQLAVRSYSFDAIGHDLVLALEGLSSQHAAGPVDPTRAAAGV